MEEEERNWRISGNVPDAVNTQVEEWAKKLGMRKTSLISLCIILGLRAIVRMAEPETALSPDLLAEVVIAMERKGVPVTLGAKDG